MGKSQEGMRKRGMGAFRPRESRFLFALVAASIPFLLDSLLMAFTGGTFLPEQLGAVYLSSFAIEALLLVYAVFTRKRRRWWDFAVPSCMMALTLVLGAYSLVQAIALDTGFRPYAVEGGTAVGWEVRETIVTSGFYIRTYVLEPMENAAEDPSHPLLIVLRDTESSFNLAQVGYFLSAAGTLLFLALLLLDVRGVIPCKKSPRKEKTRTEASEEA